MKLFFWQALICTFAFAAPRGGKPLKPVRRSSNYSRWEDSKFVYVGDMPKQFRDYIFSDGKENKEDCNLVGKSSDQIKTLLGSPITEDKYEGNTRYFYQCRRELLFPIERQAITTLWLMLVLNRAGKVVAQQHGIVKY
jgi:hypothetical protein